MRHDLVPRFSSKAVATLQEELLQIDYKTLLKADVTAHPVSDTGAERGS
jgi:hypothetical protein